MRALLTPAPDAAAPTGPHLSTADMHTLDALGLSPAAVSTPAASAAAAPAGPVEIWPCLAQVFGLFAALQTQWRHGGLGGTPTGLDYAAVPTVAQAMSLSRRTLRRLWPDLQAMERAALELFAERAAPRG